MAIRFDQPRSLAIELQFNGEQPNLFSAQRASAEPMRAGDFVGATREGGKCNVTQLQLNPHCNGTHTESIGHIVSQHVSVSQTVTGHLTQAAIVSVRTTSLDGSEESYDESARLDDRVVTAKELATAIDFVEASGQEALIVRTLPNDAGKKSQQYGEAFLPPYFTYESAQLISRMGFRHWLVDVPSVDRIYDGGRLLNHHVFWNVADGDQELGTDAHLNRSITEMIFVPDDLIDGLYVLNLQIPAFALDVAPSRPIVYPM